MNSKLKHKITTEKHYQIASRVVTNWIFYLVENKTVDYIPYP